MNNNTDSVIISSVQGFCEMASYDPCNSNIICMLIKKQSDQ